jgi:hypothetical protein
MGIVGGIGCGLVIITELSNRAKAALAPGVSRVHIYDQPLEAMAALLAIGFVLTLLVRPLPNAHAAAVDSLPVLSAPAQR